MRKKASLQFIQKAVNLAYVSMSLSQPEVESRKETDDIASKGSTVPELMSYFNTISMLL